MGPEWREQERGGKQGGTAGMMDWRQRAKHDGGDDRVTETTAGLEATEEEEEAAATASGHDGEMTQVRIAKRAEWNDNGTAGLEKRERAGAKTVGMVVAVAAMEVAGVGKEGETAGM